MKPASADACGPVMAKWLTAAADAAMPFSFRRVVLGYAGSLDIG
jgi:hypothetical protein